MNTTQSQYEKFQEWLNDCPTQIEEYQDNIDSVTIRFDTPFTEIDDNYYDKDNAEKVTLNQLKSIKSNLL